MLEQGGVYKGEVKAIALFQSLYSYSISKLCVVFKTVLFVERIPTPPPAIFLLVSLNYQTRKQIVSLEFNFRRLNYMSDFRIFPCQSRPTRGILTSEQKRLDICYLYFHGTIKGGYKNPNYEGHITRRHVGEQVDKYARAHQRHTCLIKLSTFNSKVFHIALKDKGFAASAEPLDAVLYQTASLKYIALASSKPIANFLSYMPHDFHMIFPECQKESG